MAQPSASEMLKAHIDSAVNSLREDFNAQLAELKKQIENIAVDNAVKHTEMMTALTEIATTAAAKKKAASPVAAAAPAAGAPVEEGVLAAAAKPKGKKKTDQDTAASWFQDKYGKSEEFRAKVKAIPEVKAIFEGKEFTTAYAAKKTEKTKLTCEINTVIKHCADAVNRLRAEDAPLSQQAVPE